MPFKRAEAASGHRSNNSVFGGAPFAPVQTSCIFGAHIPPSQAPPMVTRGTNTLPGTAERVFQALTQDRQDQRFCDFSVFVDEREFKCHRIVLAAMSGFFRSLFSSAMSEAVQGKVNLQGMSAESFADVMRWVYVGEPVLNRENMFDLTSAADLLGIENLLSECETFLSQNLCVENCIAVHWTSLRYFQKSALSLKSNKFLLDNFDKIAATEEFYELDFQSIKNLVADRTLVTRSEDFVIDSILRWVRFESSSDEKERGNDWAALLLENSKSIKEHDTSTQKSACQTDKEMTHSAPKAISSNVQIIGEATHDERNLDTDCPKRQDDLANLLKVTRYLRVSGNFLWHTLARDPLVQADQGCCTIQEEIIRYKTQLDCHQDACVPAASHRLSDRLKDFVMTSSDGKILCRRNREWDKIELTDSIINVEGLVYYDKDIYIRGPRKQLYVVPVISLTPVRITDDTAETAETLAMMPIGNELVSVYKQDDLSYAVETLSLQMKARSWNPVGTLSVQGMTVVSVTNIGPTLIIFWRHAGQECLSIECFDIGRSKPFRLPDIMSPTPGLVTFKHGGEAFALQDNGSLWRITQLEDEPYIALKYELCLWNCQQTISGAILYEDELMVFTPSTAALGSQVGKSVYLDNVFRKVTFVEAPQSNTGFIHAVLPA